MTKLLMRKRANRERRLTVSTWLPPGIGSPTQVEVDEAVGLCQGQRDDPGSRPGRGALGGEDISDEVIFVLK